MGKRSPGHIEQLPSGSWRVKVYGGSDPLTGREIRLRKTCKTERAAQIELGRLLEQASAGRQPETNATVAELMDKYVEVADWDLSTRKAYEAYIRRVIKPALGHLQVRKIRGPLLDMLYAQLRRCGDPGCTGKRSIQHRNVPTLSVVTPRGRPGPAASSTTNTMNPKSPTSATRRRGTPVGALNTGSYGSSQILARSVTSMSNACSGSPCICRSAPDS